MIGTEDGPPKLIEPDFVAIEARILAKMTAINGAADVVVEQFYQLAKTESGTPLFKYKLSDGSFTEIAALLHNLVVNAIQGEVSL